MQTHISNTCMQQLANLYRIVSEARNDLLVIILQAVDTLAVLTVTLNLSQGVTAILPVRLHVLGEGMTRGRTEMRTHRYTCS